MTSYPFSKPTPLPSREFLDGRTGQKSPFTRVRPHQCSHLHTVCPMLDFLSKGWSETASLGFPVILVPIKDGTIYLCIDYRKLNKVTKLEPYSMPKIEWWTTCRGPVHINTGPHDKLPAGASCQVCSPQDSIHDFLREVWISGNALWFGRGPGLFSVAHEWATGRLVGFSASYMGDLVVFSWHGATRFLIHTSSPETEGTQNHCQAIQGWSGYARSTVSGTHCGGLVHPQQLKIQAVALFVRLHTKKDIRSFLGLAGYSHRFIRVFAETTLLLTATMMNDQADRVQCTDWASSIDPAFLTAMQMVSLGKAGTN